MGVALASEQRQGPAPADRGFEPPGRRDLLARQSESGRRLVLAPDLPQGRRDGALPQAFETELLGNGPARGALLGETGAGQGGGIGIVIDETGRLEAVENLLGDAGVDLPALQEIGQSRARGG